MSSHRANKTKGTLSIRNIGGIEETAVEFSEGTTVLVGRNASNRTSLLQAVMAALGSQNVAIKGDADEASVELTLDNKQYTRQLRRRDGAIITEGEPYLDDPTLADLFAFLLESNETRRAVGANNDLRELIMRPVDTDSIEATIDRLVKQRQSLKDDLSNIQELKGKLPELEQRRTQLTEEIETKKGELEAKNQELETADTDLDQKREERSELETKLEQLSSKRTELDDLRYDLETERESLTALKQEQRDLETEVEELPESPAGEVAEIESEIEQLREQKQTLQTEANKLQNVIGFNEEMLENTDSLAFQSRADNSSEDITRQLVSDDTLQCWTCGSEVEQTQIESTVDQLREFSQSKLSELRELDDEISELSDQKRTLQQSQRQRNRLERELQEIETEIEQSEERIEQLQEKRERLTGEVETMEAAVDELQDDSDSTILTLHKEANQIEYELGTLENELEQVKDNIADVENRISKESDIEAEIDAVTDEITENRTKIERLETAAVDEFNEHMDTVLELLDYANLDRIWIERIEKEVCEGRRKVTKHVFELHIIRTSESGAAYEDTVDHLSESEREVTGLIFALAGYLAHDLCEVVPFILLDSLEAIDSKRIATLVDYLTDYTDYLLVALLPEDASALSEEYDRVTEI